MCPSKAMYMLYDYRHHALKQLSSGSIEMMGHVQYPSRITSKAMYIIIQEAYRLLLYGQAAMYIGSHTLEHSNTYACMSPLLILQAWSTYICYYIYVHMYMHVKMSGVLMASQNGH